METHDNEMQDMLEHVKEFVGAGDVQVIGLDDTFGFKCQQCGQCCMYREDIILNPFDVYNGAQYLGITPSEFIQQYAHVELGAESKIPMVLLKSTDNGFCPLLKFDIKDGCKFKCMIHEAKPGACANHPIGVMRSRKKDEGMDKEVMTFIKVDQCPNSVSDEQQVVREWVKSYLDHEEEIAYAHQMQTMVTNYLDTKEFWAMIQKLLVFANGAESEEIMEKFLSLPKSYIGTVIALGYADFDINQPFIEQAKVNIEKLDEFFTKTKELYDHLKLVADLADEHASEAFKRIFKED